MKRSRRAHAAGASQYLSTVSSAIWPRMLRLTVTNIGGARVAHRRSIEYPGFVLPSYLEPGQQCDVAGEPMVLFHSHTDGHRYHIYFYWIQSGQNNVYVCDFNPEYPSQRALQCDGRYSEHETTVIINVGASPYAFRAGPSYPGVKLNGFLERGESATVFSKFRLIPHVHKDNHVYYVHTYKLVDNSGWVPDFDPENPHKRTMHDKCGFALQEMRKLAQACGLRETHHDPTKGVAIYSTIDGAHISVYYATGTVVTSMHHPRQGYTQLFRRNQHMDGLRDIFLNPGVQPEIGYEDRGRKRGPNTPVPKHNTNVSAPPSVKPVVESLVDEEEAIRNQLKRIESEAAYLELERQRLTTALESYEKHRTAERRRQTQRSVRVAQQEAAQAAAERNSLRGTEMVCHCSNSAFVRKHWEASVSSVALGTKCEFLIYDDGAMACSDPDALPPKLLATITDKHRHLQKSPRHCALGSGGRYFMAFGTNGVEREWSAPDSFARALASLAAREAPPRGSPPGTEGKSVVKSVSFGQSIDSWIILLVDGSCLYSGVPARLQELLEKVLTAPSTPASAGARTPAASLSPSPPPTAENPYYRSNRDDLDEVTLGPSGEWFALRRGAKAGVWESKSSRFLNSAKAIRTKITAIYFGSDKAYLIRHM